MEKTISPLNGKVFLHYFITLSLLLIIPATVFAQARVDYFSPQGTVKGVRQATARFSEPMVALGDPRLPDPFGVSCPEKGKGRWIDGKNWSYDFARDLPAGVTCEFRLKPGLKSLAGNTIAGQQSFIFSTGGPAILRSRPWEGERRIDEKQIFVLFLDAPAREETILDHAYFSVEGIREKVGVRIVKGKERTDILAAIHEKRENGLIILIQAKQVFPEKATVKLVWGAGIQSTSGVATEEDQTLPYAVREPFVATFSCARERPDAGCVPVLPMEVGFSAPVPVTVARKIAITSPSGKVWKPRATGPEEEGKDRFTYSVIFEGPFPEKTVFSLDMPAGIKDDAGRFLANCDKFPLTIGTDDYPPLAKFSSRFGLIERGDPVLPVTVRNIEADIKNRLMEIPAGADTAKEAAEERNEKKAAHGSAGEERGKIVQQLRGRVEQIATDREERVIHWLRRVAEANRRESLFRSESEGEAFTLPKPGGEKAFEVIGIPLSGAGFYIVELESRILGEHLLGQPAPMYVSTAALVTNLAAHFKWGRESSLVWVTTLDGGSPVADADVSVRNCRGEILWKGRTDADGVARINQALPSLDELPSCPPRTKEEYRWRDVEHSPILRGIHDGLFVFAKTRSDMTFTHSSWDEGIEPWRFQIPTTDESEESDTIAHTVFDRPLFRTGETVHMKHVLRLHTTSGFAQAPTAKRPDEVLIEHGGSGQQYRLTLAWQANGTALSDWMVPEGAKLGTYEVTLGRKVPHSGSDAAGMRRDGALRSGSFRVEEYRVPLVKGIIQGPVAPLVKAESVELDLSVSYLAGGGASFLPVRLRGEIRDKYIHFADYDDFSFAGGPLKEGIVAPSRRGEMEEAEEETGEEEVAEQVSPARGTRLQTQDLKLDETGALRTRLTGIPVADTPKEIHAELEYRDPNGEVQTAVRSIPLYPSRRLVGIRPDSWAAAKDTLQYKVVVLDLNGKPIPDADVTVDLYREIVHSHRVRLVGGFYAYQHTREIKKIGRHFAGRTDTKGLLICEGPSPVSGSVILHAETRDDEGNSATANYTVWVAGREDWWFEAGKDDRIDVLPEKKRYEPGETARFQVRMPFREATALVTVEREGIVDVSIRKLSGKAPLIEIPVKNNYAPNVYVSVLCVRGRVGDAKPTATFDPGRPAYKIGIGEIAVGWRAHELRVNVVPNKQVFKVREEMDVRVHVGKSLGGPLPENAEVAIAAVDEGLLQLLPNGSWNILSAMMGRRPCEVMTATAQAMVVGKRHFGLKALPHGGGGGRQITRELFDTLLFWKGRVVLDDQGEAAVTIPLNDSLTSFRIVAVATAGAGLFGSGETSVRTAQDLMLLPGIPQLVREGDRFPASFTVRNASDRMMDLTVGMTVNRGTGSTEMTPVALQIPPGQAKEIQWPVAVPYDTDKLEYVVTAVEKAGEARDRLKVSQKCARAVPVRTFQATVTQVKGAYEAVVARPSDAIPGRGGISLQIRPTIGDGLAGVREYMEQYPYICLEQKVSKAIALRDEALWKGIVRQMPAYLDEDGLLKYFPSPLFTGSDVLTSYILSIARAAGYELPDHVRIRTIGALKGFIEGRIIRYGALPTADLAIRKIAAIEAVSRYEEVSGNILASIPLEPNLWPTSAVIDWLQILGRIKDLRDKDRQSEEAQQILRARMNLQGTTMGFSTERMDSLWWLMTSVDVNAVKSLLALLPYNRWEEDAPRLARGTLGRMLRGHWDTTTANAWGVLAMEAFAKKFESTPVTGVMEVNMERKKKAIDWAKAPKGDTLAFSWPKGRTTLHLTQTGTGSPWAIIRSRAAIPLKAPLSSGYTINKKLIPLEQKSKGKWSRGDVVRVRLDLEAQADMTWVVVSDPVPSGAGILRSDLGGGSSLLTASEKGRGWAWEAFTERSFEAFRTYYEYVPKGKWTVEYTLRLNNGGNFLLPTTRVEALYAPEMFGEIPNRAMDINP